MILIHLTTALSEEHLSSLEVLMIDDLLFNIDFFYAEE